LRLAVVSPFVDRRHGTERALAEVLERLARNEHCEIHLYAQRVRGSRRCSAARQPTRGTPGRSSGIKCHLPPGPPSLAIPLLVLVELDLSAPGIAGSTDFGSTWWFHLELTVLDADVVIVSPALFPIAFQEFCPRRVTRSGKVPSFFRAASIGGAYYALLAGFGTPHLREPESFACLPSPQRNRHAPRRLFFTGRMSA